METDIICTLVANIMFKRNASNMKAVYINGRVIQEYMDYQQILL